MWDIDSCYLTASHNGAAHPSSAAAGGKAKPNLAHEAEEKFVDKMAEDSADKVVDYFTEDPKQTLQDAEDEAKVRVKCSRPCRLLLNIVCRRACSTNIVDALRLKPRLKPPHIYAVIYMYASG